MRRRSSSPIDLGDVNKARQAVLNDDNHNKAPVIFPNNSLVSRETDIDDSDPLETLGLIGPAPAPQPPQTKSRGRGTFASAAVSTIDQHFKPTYDPTVDAIPDAAELGDDWDQALEALKDRQQWQQNPAERMRMAGFTELEITKWEKGRSGREGEVEDVKWREKGEGREWDRGKVVDADGHVETEAVEWGRLKGT